MPVVATSTIGANPYLNPNPPGFTPALSELDGAGERDIPNSESPPTAPNPTTINLKSALSLMDKVTRSLKAKPDWLALRVHSPRHPSLLGANYV